MRQKFIGSIIAYELNVFEYDIERCCAADSERESNRPASVDV
jgi:hypothetical protein